MNFSRPSIRIDPGTPEAINETIVKKNIHSSPLLKPFFNSKTAEVAKAA